MKTSLQKNAGCGFNILKLWFYDANLLTLPASAYKLPDLENCKGKGTGWHCR